MPMNTSVKFFSSTMLNAPKLSATKGSMISVLDACLTDGWNLTTIDSMTVSNNVVTANISAGHGFVQWQVIQVAGATPSGLNGEHRVTEVTTNTVKFEVAGVANGTATGTLKTAPLGWLKAFSGTNKAAYKVNNVKYPQSTGCLVRFDDSVGSYSTRVAGFESMSSIDLGSGQFPTDGQNPNGLWFHRTNTTSTTVYRPWVVIGDDRMFYVGVIVQNSASDYGFLWSAFGEFKSVRSGDPFNFAIATNYETDAPTTSSQTYTFANAGGSSRTNYQYLPRSYDDLGGPVPIRARSWPFTYSGSGEASAPLAYPNGPNNGLYLCPLDIQEYTVNGNHFRGTFPGVLMIPHRVVGRIVPDRQTPVLDTSIAGFEGRVIGFYSNDYSGGTYGVVAFDMTGPWEH
jgi:hypothetical protein